MRPDLHLTQRLDTALIVHQSGDLEQAARLYTQILDQYPGQADALYLYGVVHHQIGRHQEAADLILKAIAENKRNADWYNALGEVYRALDQTDAAIQAYRQALKLSPRLAEALGNLGLALHDQGKLSDAALCYQKVLRVNPQSLPALINLGSIYQEQGHYPEAYSQYQFALGVDPNCVDAHFNLGLLHYEQYRYDEARHHLEWVTRLAPENARAWLALGRTYFKLAQLENARKALEQALVLRQNHPEADYELALVMAQLGRPDEAKHHLLDAVSSSRTALATRPNDPAMQCLLGNALRELGNRSEAIACFRQAIALKSDHAEALFNLGSLLLEEGGIEEARRLLERLIKQQPGNADAYLNLGLVLQKAGELEAAKDLLLTAMQKRSEYPLAELNLGVILQEMGLSEDALLHARRAVEGMHDSSRAHSNLLLALNYVVRPPEDVFHEHLAFGARYSADVGNVRSWPNDCNSIRPLRVGYVSPDFRTHSVAYFIEPILASHDRSGFEVYCYADVRQGDEVTARIQGYPVAWRDIHLLGDEQVCERIRQDEIDILVDLAGHTAKNRMMVFARKPAPIQIAYIGYPNTTGLKEVDYRITDGWADPEGLTDRYHTEHLVRLPHGFLCYRPDVGSPDVAGVPALGSGHVTFGSFNNLAKVTDSMIALWARVLTAVPDSRFVFKAKALADGAVRERIARLFAKHDVDQSRIVFLAQIASTRGHLAAYGDIDIALDPFPYHGTTTTFEALWMGVPVVTLAGQTHAARVGVSILSRMHLPYLIANTPEEYVRIAVDLAADLSKLTELRQTMRKRMEDHGLLDAATITRDLESEYRHMWRRYCAKQSAARIWRSGRN